MYRFSQLQLIITFSFTLKTGDRSKTETLV